MHRGSLIVLLLSPIASTFAQHTSRDVFALVDTCASIGVDIDLGVVSIDAGICLCLSAVASYAQSIAPPNCGCEDNLTNRFQSLIKSSTTSVQCSFPDNATPSCTDADGTLCGWQCNYPFVTSKSGDSCICPHYAPHPCNGGCSSKPSCPSGVKAKARRSNLQPACPKDQIVCGVYSRNDAWECVDAQSDLESCGGCTVPFDSLSASGRDCSAIEHVSDVACVAGSCRVSRCAQGYAVGPDGASCVPQSRKIIFQSDREHGPRKRFSSLF